MTKLERAPAWYPPEDRQAIISDVAVLVELSANRAAKGGAILDAAELVESIWGDGHRCVWPKGEPFILCGPEGVGKTALAEQLALHRRGVLDGMDLGLPVHSSGRPGFESHGLARSIGLRHPRGARARACRFVL